MGYWHDYSNLPDYERFKKLDHDIASEYLYPSYATVEYSSELANKIEKAKTLKVNPVERKIIIDGEEYEYGVEEDVSFDTYSCETEEECERLSKQVEEEAKELYEKYEEYNKEKKDGCYWGFLENSNPDGYFASLIYICPVKR